MTIRKISDAAMARSVIADLNIPLAALAIGVAVLSMTTFEPPRGGVQDRHE